MTPADAWDLLIGSALFSTENSGELPPEITEAVAVVASLPEREEVLTRALARVEEAAVTQSIYVLSYGTNFVRAGLLQKIVAEAKDALAALREPSTG